jgi:hypothetical protein
VSDLVEHVELGYRLEITFEQLQVSFRFKVTFEDLDIGFGFKVTLKELEIGFRFEIALQEFHILSITLDEVLGDFENFAELWIDHRVNMLGSSSLHRVWYGDGDGDENTHKASSLKIIHVVEITLEQLEVSFRFEIAFQEFHVLYITFDEVLGDFENLAELWIYYWVNILGSSSLHMVWYGDGNEKKITHEASSFKFIHVVEITFK